MRLTIPPVLPHYVESQVTMQQALDTASAAIDTAILEYASQIGVMEQEIATKKAELAGMDAAMALHKAHHNAFARLRIEPERIALAGPQTKPAPDDVWPPEGLSPGAGPQGSGRPQDLASAIVGVMTPVTLSGRLSGEAAQQTLR